MTNINDIPARVSEMYAARYEPEGVRPLAEAYWRTLLLFGCGLTVGALVYGAGALFATLDSLTAANNAPLSVGSFNATALHHVVDGFGARKTQFENFGSSPPAPTADPSR